LKKNNVLNTAIKLYLKSRIAGISENYNDPLKLQHKQLHYLIKAASDTEFGRKFNFRKIKTAEQFAEQVPVHSYEMIKPYFQKAMEGNPSVTWPGRTSWFAKTSGSAEDKSKFIPVSIDSLHSAHYRSGLDILAIYYDKVPDSELFQGKGLILGGSHKLHEANNGVRFGDLSAVLIENIYPVANYFRVPSKEIALMDNWDLKIDKLIEATSSLNVTNISGVPSWMLVLLKKMMAEKGADHVNQIWPNLELFIHGAVSFDPYYEQFKKIIPNPRMTYMETYNASEGFFALQDTLNSKEMLLMLNYGIYYEFLPINSLHDYTKTITLDKVQPDVPYAMIISTNSGIWRYFLGDTIKFTAVNPYRIKITGRTKHFINAFGEELVIENADKAVTEACRATNAEIVDYTAAPVYMTEENTGAHEWLIEFEKNPHDPEKFAKILDESLKKLNSDYEAKRSGNFILRFPKIKILPKGTFEKWLKSKNKLGGQHKVPRLSNERKYVEEILRLSGL
jgi:hypothetical protein